MTGMLKVSWQKFPNSHNKDANSEQLWTCLKQMKKYRQPSKEIYRLSKEIEDTKKQVELLKLKNKITEKKNTQQIGSAAE